MSGKGNVNGARFPCGRAAWCGRESCPHAAACMAVQAGAAPSGRAAWAEGWRGKHWYRDAWSGDYSGENARPPHAEMPRQAKMSLPEPEDLVYLYDGSLAGFFCCVFESVYAHELPAAIETETEANPSLFRQKTIVTEPEKAGRVEASVPKKIGARAAELTETVFLSCLPQRELALLRFLRLGYQAGACSPWLFGHPDVVRVLKAEEHLLGETHLLKGFVRFSDYGGVLAAAISPKNFVLPFLAGHFSARYAQERFLIYDKTHRAALIYENGQSKVLRVEHIEFPKADETEERYRGLWKRFYHTVSIEARENPRCRMTHMPKRYWENMTEMAELL